MAQKKIAVGVGYVFTVVDADLVQHINLVETLTTVKVDNEYFVLHKGASYQDSLKVDELLDALDNEMQISDYVCG